MARLTPPFGIRDWVVLALAVFLVWSGINPADFLTWCLEVFWVAGAVVMWAFWLRRQGLTSVLFWLIVAHSVVLIVGGIYTYSEVPAGRWVQEWLGLERNHYDRFGHFMQGFAPALLWREVFLRNAIVRRCGWLPVIVVGMCMAFAAMFELLEFAVAMVLGEASWAYLGSQGDVWDAQWDLLWCLVGSIVAIAALGPLQDTQMARERGVTRP